MNLLKHFFYTTLFIFWSGQSIATNYYLSSSGNNRDKGTSKLHAWRTLERLHTVALKPGDSIFLRRGDLFRGRLEITTSGSKNAPIVFTSYGVGEDAVLSGAIEISQWNRQSAQRFSAACPIAVSDLFINGQRLNRARYPNAGFLSIDSGSNKTAIQAKSIHSLTYPVIGAAARMRTIDWTYETRKVASYKNDWLSLEPHPSYPEAKDAGWRSNNGQTTIYELRKGYGFYLDGLTTFIDTLGEWAQNKNVLEVQYERQPNKAEGVVEKVGIKIQPFVSNIDFVNLRLQHYSYAGLQAGSNVSSIHINQCTFADIHTFGILMDSASSNCVISNIVVQDILGKGISISEPSYLTMEHNLVKRIGLIPGQGFSGINGAAGIVIHNNEKKDLIKPVYGHHNIIRLNHVDSCGYNGIRVDGSYNVIEYNIIENCGQTLNDGAALYCFATNPGITHHQTFRYNIVKNSTGNVEGTPANAIHFNGIYIDNNCHDILVEGNTSMDHSSAGILNNDGSFRNTFQNNVVYNCRSGIDQAEWGRPGKLYGNRIEGNTVVALSADQKLVQLLNFIGTTTDFALFNGNTYIHTKRTNPFYRETKQTPANSKLFLSFGDWKLLCRGDSGSAALMVSDPFLKDHEPVLLTNPTLDRKRLSDFKGTYFNKEGVELKNTMIEAFQSIVLFKQRTIQP